MAGIIPEQDGDTVGLQDRIDHLESDLQAERKRWMDTQEELMKEVKRRSEVEADLLAEQCCFKNEETCCKNLEEHLEDEKIP